MANKRSEMLPAFYSSIRVRSDGGEWTLFTDELCGVSLFRQFYVLTCLPIRSFTLSFPCNADCYVSSHATRRCFTLESNFYTGINIYIHFKTTFQFDLRLAGSKMELILGTMGPRAFAREVTDPRGNLILFYKMDS